MPAFPQDAHRPARPQAERRIRLASRRRTARLVAGLALAAGGLLPALLLPGLAAAQSWPTRPIRLVVPAAAGDGSDVLARTLGKALGPALGQPVVIENRPGAGGSLGADAVAKAAPDGHTVFLANGSTHGPTPSLYPKLPYDSIADFAPVVLIGSAPNVLIVGPKVPVANVADLLELARREPGRLTFGSAGSGSISHLSVELLKRMADVDLLHVPYKGAAPAVNDVVAGQITGMIINVPTVRGLLADGRLKALAVTSLAPAAALPGVPTLDGAGVAGYQTMAWFGLMVPAGTPDGIVQALFQATAGALRQPEMKEALARLGAEPSGLGPEAFAAHVRSEIAKYGRIIREADVRVE